MKKFRILISSTSFNVVNHFYKELLSHSNVAKMYEQRIFFEHIFIDKTHCDVKIRFSKSEIYEQFIRISKFFVINISFEQLLKSI